MRLYDPLPSSVTVNGREYQLDLSFDNVLFAQHELADNLLLPTDRIDTYLSLLVKGKLPEADQWANLFSAINELLENEPEEPLIDLNGDPVEAPPQEKKTDFDLDFDADYIYAAFRQAYGIDLITEQGKLHWLQFAALLRGLPSGTKFDDILGIRNADLSEYKGKDNAKTRARLKELKERVALPERSDDDG
jgi:hypothetical protein